jgi:hypothetical protein
MEFNFNRNINFLAHTHNTQYTYKHKYWLRREPYWISLKIHNKISAEYLPRNQDPSGGVADRRDVIYNHMPKKSLGCVVSRRPPEEVRFLRWLSTFLVTDGDGADGI